MAASYYCTHTEVDEEAEPMTDEATPTGEDPPDGAEEDSVPTDEVPPTEETDGEGQQEPSEGGQPQDSESTTGKFFRGILSLGVGGGHYNYVHMYNPYYYAYNV